MLDVTLCNYHAPCGLCTYYNKPCSAVCNLNKSVLDYKCECYVIEHGKTVCYGTNECEECTCCGDKRRCNFYNLGDE